MFFLIYSFFFSYIVLIFRKKENKNSLVKKCSFNVKIHIES